MDSNLVEEVANHKVHYVQENVRRTKVHEKEDSIDYDIVQEIIYQVLDWDYIRMRRRNCKIINKVGILGHVPNKNAPVDCENNDWQIRWYNVYMN